MQILQIFSLEESLRQLLIAVIKSHLATFPPQSHWSTSTHTHRHGWQTESWQHQYHVSGAPFLPLVFFSFYFVFVLYKSVAHIQFCALRRPPLALSFALYLYSHPCSHSPTLALLNVMSSSGLCARFPRALSHDLAIYSIPIPNIFKALFSK